MTLVGDPLTFCEGLNDVLMMLTDESLLVLLDDSCRDNDKRRRSPRNPPAIVQPVVVSVSDPNFWPEEHGT